MDAAQDGGNLLTWALGILGAIGTGLGGFALTRSVSHGEDIKAIKATCAARAAQHADTAARLDRIEDKLDRLLER